MSRPSVLIPWRSLLLGLVLVALLPTEALAQERRFEISPFVGYRTGSKIVDDDLGTSVDLQNGTAYGFMADVSVSSNVQVEFLWSHTKTDVNIGLEFGGGIPPVEVPVMALYVDYFHGGVLYQFDTSSPNFKPFIVGTVGATVFTPEYEEFDTTTSFSWGVGGGIKYFFGRNFGFRAEYRLLSARTDFVDTDIFCNPSGFCYRVNSQQNLWQSQFGAALVIAF